MTRAPKRRAFLAGSFAVPVAALPAMPVDRVKEAADAIAVVMQARHGGQWRAHVDHDVGLVLVCPAIEKKGGAL